MLYRTRNPHGGDVYSQPIRLDYSANTNPYGTPAGVLDAIQAALPQVHQYPDPYCRELVQAIAAHEQTAPAHILCGSGAAELIYVYGRAVQPRKAAELAPTFSEYALSLENAGCPISRFFLRQEDDFSVTDRFLEFLTAEKPDVLYLCNPNNPTGRLLSRAQLLPILNLCRERNIRVFLDECFLDLTGQDESCVPLLEAYPNLLILKAFTKSYGMAGVRLGYCLSADPDLLHRMSSLTQPWNVSTLAQKAGVAALRERAFLAQTIQTVTEERAFLRTQLQLLGFYVCPGQANYLLFRAPAGLDTALRAQGIAIRSCANYHGLCEGWYRIAVRLHAQNEELLSAIRHSPPPHFPS